MIQDMTHWTPRAQPQRCILEGRYVRLEPLAPHHGDDLFHIAHRSDEKEKFRYLFDSPPKSRKEFKIFMHKAGESIDPLFFAVIDQATGCAVGRQALMRVDVTHGVIEIGHIYWGPDMRGRRQATEAQFLFADYVFGDLGYRRYEWKCDNNNVASKEAAQRFGFVFEGIFRQHMVMKGKNRDTAWFAMLDRDWQCLRQAYMDWLQPDNFNKDGQQKTRLSTLIGAAKQQNS